jgi:hypothetical protein
MISTLSSKLRVVALSALLGLAGASVTTAAFAAEKQAPSLKQTQAQVQDPSASTDPYTDIVLNATQ